ncbi:hypothetical protein BDN67DRAFT_972305 [Paxillus ammoniavirescens]|nr:hypothetical protein BDN67DRAFT_972305 [Paxillus ammoniavirescens]
MIWCTFQGAMKRLRRAETPNQRSSVPRRLGKVSCNNIIAFSSNATWGLLMMATLGE